MRSRYSNVMQSQGAGLDLEGFKVVYAAGTLSTFPIGAQARSDPPINDITSEMIFRYNMQALERTRWKMSFIRQRVACYSVKVLGHQSWQREC